MMMVTMMMPSYRLSLIVVVVLFVAPLARHAPLHTTSGLDVVPSSSPSFFSANVVRASSTSSSSSTHLEAMKKDMLGFSSKLRDMHDERHDVMRRNGRDTSIGNGDDIFGHHQQQLHAIDEHHERSRVHHTIGRGSAGHSRGREGEHLGGNRGSGGRGDDAYITSTTYLDDTQVVSFVHVPKSGGSGLRSTVGPLSCPNKVFNEIYLRPLPCGMHCTHEQQRACLEVAMSSDPTATLLPPARLIARNPVKPGLYPSNTLVHWITWLRHPIARVESDFFFARELQSGRAFKATMSWPLELLQIGKDSLRAKDHDSLMEFFHTWLRHPANPVHNRQAWMFVPGFYQCQFKFGEGRDQMASHWTEHYGSAAWSPLLNQDDEIGASAIDTLATYKFVGILERREESVRTVKKLLRCNERPIRDDWHDSAHHGQRPPFYRGLSGEDREEILRLNRQDLAVYEWAVERLDYVTGFHGDQ